MRRRDVLKSTAGGFALSPVLVGGKSPWSAVGSGRRGAVTDTHVSLLYDFRSDTVRGTFADVRSYSLPDFFGTPAGRDAFATAVGMLYPGGVPVDEYDWASVAYETTELDDGCHAVHSVALPIEPAMFGTWVEWCSPNPLTEQCATDWGILSDGLIRFLTRAMDWADLLGSGAQSRWRKRNNEWAANPEDAPISVCGNAEERRMQAAVLVREQFESLVDELFRDVKSTRLPDFEPAYSVDVEYRGPGGTPAVRVTYDPVLDGFFFECRDLTCFDGRSEELMDCFLDVEEWSLKVRYERVVNERRVINYSTFDRTITERSAWQMGGDFVLGPESGRGIWSGGGVVTASINSEVVTQDSPPDIIETARVASSGFASEAVTADEPWRLARLDDPQDDTLWGTHYGVWWPGVDVPVTYSQELEFVDGDVSRDTWTDTMFEVGTASWITENTDVERPLPADGYSIVDSQVGGYWVADDHHVWNWEIRPLSFEGGCETLSR